jgi:hypothetical protein
MLGISSSLVKGGASLLTFVKDNLKLYLDFNSKKSDTLKFPSEGSTSFDGSDDNIAISHSSDLSFGTNPHTISAWAKLDVLANFKTIISKRQAGGTATDYNLSVGANGVVYTYNGSATAQTATGVISTGSWFHYALVYNGSAYQLYINGSAVAWASGTTTSGASNSHDVAIGWDRTGNYWDGQIANVALWSRELTPEEIQSIQNKSYSQLKGVEKTSLVMWQSLDSASNGVVQPHDGESTTLISNRDFAGVADGTDPTTLSYIFAYGVPSEKTIDNERLKIVNSNNSGVYWKETGLTSSKLYKITIEATGDVASGGVYSTDVSFTLSNGTFTGYVTGKTQIIVYLRANNNSAGTTFYDNLKTEEVTSNTGYVTGATTTTSVYGGNAPVLPRAVDTAREGQADAIGNGSASFNGSSDRISFSPLSITGDASFTITAWIKPDTITGGNTVVVFGDDDTTDSAKRVALYFNAGKPYFAFWGSDVLHNSSVIQANEWQHFAITYSGGNTTTANSAIYLNGVSLSLTGGTASPLLLENDIFQIGADHNPSQYFDGLISQVGIWRGALTQSQVQEVLESTSYSKIPADVKSTLGSEIASNNFAGWTLNGWTDNGDNTASANNSSGGNQDLTLSYSFTASTLYKITATFSNISGNFYYSMDGTGGLDKTITTNGEQILYVKTASGGASSFFIRSSNGSSATISNVSIKEVFNDIVAYYPLDGDSSANGVTQDVTTGEVLGNELMGSDTDFTLSGTQSASTTGTHWITGANWTISNGKAIYDDGGNTKLEVASSTFQDAGLYKFSFDISDASSGARIKLLAGSNELIASTTYQNGTNTVYFNKSSSFGSAKDLEIEGRTEAGTFKIDNVSVKKVTSNTGVLK